MCLMKHQTNRGALYHLLSKLYIERLPDDLFTLFLRTTEKLVLDNLTDHVPNLVIAERFSFDCYFKVIFKRRAFVNRKSYHRSFE